MDLTLSIGKFICALNENSSRAGVVAFVGSGVSLVAAHLSKGMLRESDIAISAELRFRADMNAEFIRSLAACLERPEDMREDER